ncbi:MAG TPA: preprotein translocase subunit SecG [Thermoanaerobaculia bacterium]|nr:preprotein translocase subunit SecG [Thermoanaerobaculia bacterium]
MEIAYIALVVVYIFVCFFLILVVLLQQGKGADIAGAFGGGGSQTAFGARGATTLLHKLTTGAFVGFIVLALTLTLIEARPRSSVVRTLPAKAATEKAPVPAATQPAGAVAPVPAPVQPGTTAPAPAQPGTSEPAAPPPPPANPPGGPASP